MNNPDSNSVITEEEHVVKHEGVVSKITGRDITISLKGNINCEACNAKAACGVSESSKKEIIVQNSEQSLKINQDVEIQLKRNLGLKAVFWAYVFPFILLISVLLITSSFYKEWIAGLLSISVLIPYYAALYLLRDEFKKTFIVTILKLT